MEKVRTSEIGNILYHVLKKKFSYRIHFFRVKRSAGTDTPDEWQTSDDATLLSWISARQKKRRRLGVRWMKGILHAVTEEGKGV